jgi:hypothetical protein
LMSGRYWDECDEGLGYQLCIYSRKEDGQWHKYRKRKWAIGWDWLKRMGIPQVMKQACVIADLIRMTINSGQGWRDSPWRVFRSSLGVRDARRWIWHQSSFCYLYCRVRVTVGSWEVEAGVTDC